MRPPRLRRPLQGRGRRFQNTARAGRRPGSSSATRGRHRPHLTTAPGRHPEYDESQKDTHTLKKIILGLLAATAVAAPIAASAPSANAATTDANGVVTVAKAEVMAQFPNMNGRRSRRSPWPTASRSPAPTCLPPPPPPALAARTAPSRTTSAAPTSAARSRSPRSTTARPTRSPAGTSAPRARASPPSPTPTAPRRRAASRTTAPSAPDTAP